MFKILKYSKPYLIMVFISIGLLFAQANLDLALPDYLSNIVDTGLQQGGVEYATPVAIRQSELERVFIFMNPENQTSVLAEYTLIDENSTNYESSKEIYPILVNESIYTLNKVKKATLEMLDQVLVKPLVVIFTLEQAYANPENATEIFAALGFNVTTLPPESVFFSFLSTLSFENRTLIINIISQYYSVLGESALNQVAVMKTRLEYEVIGMDVDKIQSRYILKIGGLMLLMTLLSVICTISVSFLASRTAAGMARNIRTDIFKKVENFSNIEFDKFSTASLITRSTNDVTQIQNVVGMIIRMVFYAPILGIGGIIRALNKNTSMWWLIGLAVLILLVIVLIVFLVALPKFNRMQSLTDRLNLVSRENLSGMMVIRAFNMEKHEENRFDKANLDLTKVILFINRLMVILMPLMMLIMNGLVLSIIWVGSHQVADGFMQVGDMLAFMQYSMQIVMAFLMLTMMFIILPRAVISSRRITEILVSEPEIKDPENPKTFPEKFEGIIEFKNVCFKYPGAKKNALQNLSFTARPGQTTAIIGATGCGKTTVINLIPRFYDVCGGSIRIAGIDIRDVTQNALRDKIGYVPQKSSLFSGTIESNLLFADENATEESMQSALEIAQAMEFVSSKPEGIHAEIAQGGINVSGGQKQRLSIARALVKQPPIYIFDDSVSALDFKTDAALRKALKERLGGSTVLMITQRVSTIKDAEQIIVLEEGKIVGLGTHSELMETCEIYKEIAISQLELEGFS
ncbi:MAG TPA: ABC transporter ATP-binding protein [Candidatus Bathyarchaeia archaeon]|nr:ABC transporter ATP-binding protein [Candidatus Bathyarchaeia archaeon]